jgi:molybdopterin converting factor small subunit
MQVRLLLFARLRELLGQSERTLELPEGSCVRDLWPHLEAIEPQSAAMRACTRAARAGAMIGADEALRDGDELALLPPVGGG